MGSRSLEEVPDGDYTEAQLLADPVSQDDDEESGDLGGILYWASFAEMEDSYVNYDTVQWILISLLLILVYGVGLLMILYIPVRRYVVRKDIQTRKLYVTGNSVVYKVTRPVFLPCFGLSRREKHVFLHLITDVVVEQGCLQSSYGVSSVRIEGLSSHSQPSPGDDVRIQGMANPRLFRKIVLNAASNLRRGQRESGQSDQGSASTSEESRMYEAPPPEKAASQRIRQPQHWAWRPGLSGLASWQDAYSPYSPQPTRNTVIDGEALLRKLEGIEASVKRLESLIGAQRSAPRPDPSAPDEESTPRRAERGETMV